MNEDLYELDPRQPMRVALRTRLCVAGASLRSARIFRGSEPFPICATALVMFLRIMMAIFHVERATSR